MSLQVFISYGHATPDIQIAESIASIFNFSDIPFWKDEGLQNRTGMGLNQEIAHAIWASSHVLFLASGMSLSSNYCQAEIAYALELGKPVIYLPLDTDLEGSIPEQLLPLKPIASRAVNFSLHSPNLWRTQIVEACARCGLPLRLVGVDPVLLSPETRIIRPDYLTLKHGSPSSWASITQRLADAHSIAPDNAYTLVSLSLLRTFLGKSDLACCDAEKAIFKQPSLPDAYYAAALACCQNQRFDRRSKPETDSILEQLRTGRRQPNAGNHLWLLSALVTHNFYDTRYLPPPEPLEAILQEGSSRHSFPGECQRCWDVEGVLHANTPYDWAAAANTYSFALES